MYDMKIDATRPFGLHGHGGGVANSAARKRASQQPTTFLQIFLFNIIRPRTFIFGTAAVFMTAYASTYLFGPKTEAIRDGRNLVEAWKNPKTGEWEQPAPWDPTYQQLKPALELVPREQVKRRHM
jgi:hypothetical protein